MIIYYVGAEVDFNSRVLLHHHFGTEMKRPHATIIYSRKWFPYRTAKCFPLILEPPYTLSFLKDSLVLKFDNSRLFERHIELRNLGATSDYDGFFSHITISEGIKWDIKNLPIPNFPITLSHEYYGTWKEKRRNT